MERGSDTDGHQGNISMLKIFKTSKIFQKQNNSQNILESHSMQINPWDGKNFGAESVRQQVETSLKRLKVKRNHHCQVTVIIIAIIAIVMITMIRWTTWTSS